MSFRPALSCRCSRTASLLVSCAAATLILGPGVSRGQAVAVEAAPAAGKAMVPPVPDGTPAELMAFVQGLLPPKVPLNTQEERLAYMQAAARASVQAADKILAQVKPDGDEAVAAARLKLESLTMLARFGGEQAEKDMAAYAATLAGSGNAELAKEANRMLFVADAQRMFAADNLADAPALIDRVVAMVAADPDDVQTAGLAMQFASFFETVPGGEPHAVKALQALGPAFAGSKNPQIQKLGESFAGTLRRLSLPGKPMEIKGTLLGGAPFDQKSLAGKVVLVDFWATWCGPCLAEIPNMLEQYEKYHDKGFEIVGISLDEDRGQLESFVTDKKIPWPILFEQPAEGGNALARFYGITGIPQLILIGRDGNVITLNARGPKLEEELAKLFKDAG
jgi:thiol-disulfide isomerase/thioredoxin